MLPAPSTSKHIIEVTTAFTHRGVIIPFLRDKIKVETSQKREDFLCQELIRHGFGQAFFIQRT